MAKGSVVIWDPTPENSVTPEQMIRPKEEGIIQLEMEDMEFYSLYIYPDHIEEFEDPESLERSVTRKVKDHFLDDENNRRSAADIFFEVDSLVRIGLSLMANYRIANIDLNERRAYKVIPPRLRS